MNDENKQNQQPEATTHPEDNGVSANKTFTQEEVNRIVSERLARERTKAAEEPSEADRREKELAQRENALKCKELVLTSEDYPKELLEVFDTTDFEKFKENADKLLKAFPTIGKKAPRVVKSQYAPINPACGYDGGRLADAFKPRI